MRLSLSENSQIGEEMLFKHFGQVYASACQFFPNQNGGEIQNGRSNSLANNTLPMFELNLLEKADNVVQYQLDMTHEIAAPFLRFFFTHHTINRVLEMLIARKRMVRNADNIKESTGANLEKGKSHNTLCVSTHFLS